LVEIALMTWTFFENYKIFSLYPWRFFFSSYFEIKNTLSWVLTALFRANTLL